MRYEKASVNCHRDNRDMAFRSGVMGFGEDGIMEIVAVAIMAMCIWKCLTMDEDGDNDE